MENKQKKYNMPVIGIFTGDKLKTDPSLKVFKMLEDEYGFSLSIVDALKSNDQTSPKVDVVYPRITGKNERVVKKQIDNYKQFISTKKHPYIGNMKIIDFQKNKYYQVIKAYEAGIRAPKTIIVDKKKSASEYFIALGAPFVLKATHSFGGDDVHLIHSEEQFKKIVRKKKEYLAQEFIDLKNNVEDYRVYMINYQVSGGLLRKSQKKGEFRANVSQGGVAKFFMPDEKVKKYARKYARYVGLEICSVDFIKKDDDYYFVELNDAFSVKVGKKDPYKLKVAKDIVKYLLKKVKNGNR